MTVERIYYEEIQELLKDNKKLKQELEAVYIHLFEVHECNCEGGKNV